jgi:hypothetical protein
MLGNADAAQFGNGSIHIQRNSQGGVNPKYHSFVEFAFEERKLGDCGLRI